MHCCYYSLVLVICFYLRLGIGEECLPLENNPCIAKCNGTTFDISKLFEYPLNITGAYGVNYIWDPCTGLKCPKTSQPDPNVAVCQGNYVDCGQNKRPVFLLQQQDPYMFTVEYPNGATWRLSMFQFIEDRTHPETKVTFVNEKPNLQYNFVVTGKCVGQPNCRT